MAGKDLRALFGANAVEFDAVHVFADRDDERHAFDRAVESHRQAVAQGRCDPQDLTSPRNNVLAFYGVGGIGKTTLSRQLEGRIGTADEQPPAGWPAVPAGLGDMLTVRLDLSPEIGLDFESMVLMVRVAFGRLRRSMPAFDLAFNRYWSAAHPNERLDDYLRHHTVLGRAAEALRLPEQLGDVATEMANLLGLHLLGAAAVARAGSSIATFLRDRSRQKHVLKNCLRLPDLLEADPGLESLSYYPHLLAWDLGQLQRSQRKVALAVFVDTFEEVGTRTNRQLEQLVQRIVWVMPNAFFVVTGRNRIDWDDGRLAGQLDWVGGTSWPGLAIGAPEDPRQHLVGYLSDHDAEGYLRDRLTQAGRPMIPEAVRARIVANAKGLPLYLDLSVMRFIHIIGAGREAQPDDFDGPFQALVAAVFRDLSPDERAVLRAITLVDAFDIDLAVAAANGLRREMSGSAPPLFLCRGCRTRFRYGPRSCSLQRGF